MSLIFAPFVFVLFKMQFELIVEKAQKPPTRHDLGVTIVESQTLDKENAFNRKRHRALSRVEYSHLRWG